jgi:uncharacterized membrane protein
VTAWVGANWRSPVPVASYGVIQLLAGLSYSLLQRALVAEAGRDSVLARALLGSDWKEHLSIVLYAAAIGLAFVRPWLAELTFVLIVSFWLIPDPRIARQLAVESSPTGE